jgi:PAS domain S-box-containing protein
MEAVRKPPTPHPARPRRRQAARVPGELDAMALLKAAALDASDDGIVISDARKPDQPIVYVSPSFERLVGYDKAEILGTNCRMVQGPGTDRDTIRQISAALKAGKVFQGEILNYRRDGTPFWNELRIAPIRDARGRVTHFIGAQSDVTAQHRARERQQEIEAALAHASRVRTVAALGASLAHEVNQPLAAIATNAEAAVRFLGAGNLGEVRDALQAIAADAHRAGEIILRARRLVRNQPVKVESVDAMAVAAEVLAFARARLREAGVSTALEGKPAPRVVADPIHLHQALLNLVLNAAEAMEAEPPQHRRVIAVRVAAAPGGVRIAVSDTGPGADDESLARMAQTFHTTKPRGTGLGLLVTRSLAEAHGGRLSVARNRGRGLTFTLHLPGESP